MLKTPKAFVKLNRISNVVPRTGNDRAFKLLARMIPGDCRDATQLFGTSILAADATWEFEAGDIQTSILNFILTEDVENPEIVSKLSLPMKWFQFNSVVHETYPMKNTNSQISPFMMDVDVHLSLNDDSPFSAPPGSLLVYPAWKAPIHGVPPDFTQNRVLPSPYVPPYNYPTYPPPNAAPMQYQMPAQQQQSRPQRAEVNPLYPPQGYLAPGYPPQGYPYPMPQIYQLPPGYPLPPGAVALPSNQAPFQQQYYPYPQDQQYYQYQYSSQQQPIPQPKKHTKKKRTTTAQQPQKSMEVDVQQEEATNEIEVDVNKIDE